MWWRRKSQKGIFEPESITVATAVLGSTAIIPSSVVLCLTIPDHAIDDDDDDDEMPDDDDDDDDDGEYVYVTNS